MGGGSKMGGSPQFQAEFGDMLTANQDSGLGGPAKPKRQIDWAGLMDGLLESAAIAQGGPGAAAEMRNRRKPSLAEELALYEQKQRIEQKYAKPPSPYNFQDNAGNQMQFDPTTGQVRPIYVDPSDRTYFANGSMVTVPNKLRTSPGPASTAAPPVQPGTVEDGYRFNGGDPGDPSSWSKVGGAAVPPPVPFPVRRSFRRLG